MNVAYNKDCMAGMKDYPDGYFNLAIVDPPYGINVGKRYMGAGGGVAPHKNKSAMNKRLVNIGGGKHPAGIYKAFDDSSTPDAEYFEELKRVSKNQIIWGGNYFLDYLGATECMVVWDKKRRGINYADCEIAWTSLKQPCRVFEFLWNGMLQQNMKEKEERIHPTQKPVALYRWLLNTFAVPGDKILDTHLGSGSSRIAAYDLGYEFVGFEVDSEYFNLEEERFKEHTSQLTLFV